MKVLKKLRTTTKPESRTKLIVQVKNQAADQLKLRAKRSRLRTVVVVKVLTYFT